MMCLDKDSVECDLAETYHIYNYRELPLRRVALYCAGLRENSRIKMKMNGLNYSLDTLLNAAILDRLSIILWAKTKDAEKGVNQPESIYDKLMGIVKESDILSFENVEEFEAYRNTMLKGGK